MDKCRGEFEIFWTARCCVIGIECVLTRLINGDYYDIKAYYAWIGWSERQKSMQAIRLPVVVGADMDGSNQVVMAGEVIAAITTAGYRVEE